MHSVHRWAVMVVSTIGGHVARSGSWSHYVSAERHDVAGMLHRRSGRRRCPGIQRPVGRFVLGRAAKRLAGHHNRGRGEPRSDAWRRCRQKAGNVSRPAPGLAKVGCSPQVPWRAGVRRGWLEFVLVPAAAVCPGYQLLPARGLGRGLEGERALRLRALQRGHRSRVQLRCPGYPRRAQGLAAQPLVPAHRGRAFLLQARLQHYPLRPAIAGPERTRVLVPLARSRV